MRVNIRTRIGDQAVPSQTVVAIGEASFLVDSEPKATLPAIDDRERWIPATVIHWDKGQFDDNALEGVVGDFYKQDDVWFAAFLEIVVFVAPAKIKANNEFKRGSRLIRPNHPIGSDELPGGPYLLHSSSGHVYPVLRLFSDHNDSFAGTVASRSDETRPFKLLDPIKEIGVPSRLYSPPPSKDRPLSGLRFGVEDTIDVVGLTSGCGSACWRQLHPPAERNAPFIDRLVAAGAILVGKLRCGQFCDSQDPLDRFEEVTPTNPRGDGFQNPSGSGSGPAAASASYPWLDFTIGVDTNGSIRHPAGVNGVYGLRPSLGAVKSAGFTCSSLMDTIGVLARSAAVVGGVTRCITNGTDEVRDSQVGEPGTFKLFYAVESETKTAGSPPKFFSAPGSSVSNAEASAVFEDFMKMLERRLDCQRQPIWLDDVWKKTRPKDTPESLAAATAAIYRNVVCRDLSRNTIQPFVQEYRDFYSGRAPFIEPLTKARLEYGARVTDQEYDSAVGAFKTYDRWINETLLPSSSGAKTRRRRQETPILVLPRSWGQPQYRDEGGGPIEDRELFEDGFSVYSISSCSGCPDITIPVGQVKFKSKVGEVEGTLPVAVSLLAPRGSDPILLQLLATLEEEGILKVVECGPSLYK